MSSSSRRSTTSPPRLRKERSLKEPSLCSIIKLQGEVPAGEREGEQLDF